MQHRCAWTNDPADNLKEVVLVVPNRFGTRPAPKTFFVLPEYEERLRQFVRLGQRFGLAFLTSMLVLTLAIPIAAVTRRYVLAGTLVASEGILMIVFPFATPETVNRLGFGASITLVRVVAFFVILLGAYLSIRTWSP
jgi:hypothetical protein